MAKLKLFCVTVHNDFIFTVINISITGKHETEFLKLSVAYIINNQQ